eukprot:11166401-Lingulodinium_polyedra.AAC.1
MSSRSRSRRRVEGREGNRGGHLTSTVGAIQSCKLCMSVALYEHVLWTHRLALAPPALAAARSESARSILLVWQADLTEVGQA